MTDHDGRKRDSSTGDDDALLAALAAAATPPPAELREAGRVAWSWRTVDAELAELVFDSAEHAGLTGVRGGGHVRQLSFSGGGLTMEVEVGEGDTLRLTGQLVPPQRARVEVWGPQFALSEDTDDLGRFSLAGIPRDRPVRLRCTTSGPTARVDTDWVVL